ncbi:unnamed protein product [Phytophthora fragariaefolia]|uniref:Unnamed protein product n=1 Tax=Phytophthora fragariaefolia TaxID=1490495 RepID=A0A9W6YAK4_9STRA|nr:unnamed protein product [Phytophthora fragariaefolia]
MAEFTERTTTMLDSGTIRLMDDVNVDNRTDEQVQQWLESAIDNMYSCLYTSAKALWGEGNQSRRQIARATIRPRYLDTNSPDDVETLPEFAREWIIPDIERGGRYSAAWQSPGQTWDDLHYTAETQAAIDRQLKQRVAPGYGGASQEMWGPLLQRSGAASAALLNSSNFGIGQGSILVILHIGVYMDCLQDQLAKCSDPVQIRHRQEGHGIDIGSTMFVDDQLDVSTTFNGLLDRARITNLFTGKFATRGVFGSAKSFQMYIANPVEHYPAVLLNDGRGTPQPVQVVPPSRVLSISRQEAYQVRAGLTCNKLCHPIRPPRRAQTWIAQVIRYAASFDPPLAMAVKWTQPPTARSRQSNDRPLLGITPREHRHTLISINWKGEFKLRFVGDISSDMGSQLLPLTAILRLGRWSDKDRAKVTNLYNHWIAALALPTSHQLRSPIRCLPIAPHYTQSRLRIGVGQWVVAVKMNVDGAEPFVDHYEVGYREIGDVGMHPLGRTIPIRWWYERPRSSDVWYERTYRVVEDEFEVVCVPVTPTYLPPTSTGRQRVIMWTLTDIDGLHLVNDERILDEALARGRMRYLSTQQYGHTIDMETDCSVCGRYRDGEWCRIFRFQWYNSPNNTQVPAGDGSVMATTSPLATGTWAMQQPDGPSVTGRLAIHRNDITSTRCEVHALIAGLVASGDTWEQVCDNKSAIQIFSKARNLANGALRHIKYRDPPPNRNSNAMQAHATERYDNTTVDPLTSK